MLQKVTVLVALSVSAVLAQKATPNPEKGPSQTIAQKTAEMRHLDGLFPLDWDAKAGKLYLEIKELDKDFLLLDQLPYGLGSNDIGLDRGQLGQSRVVHFWRGGPKVLLIEPNLQYRSSSPSADERLAVKQSFAESVLWGFTIEAEENGRLLVDATDFFLRDAHGVADQLQQTRQGTYRIDSSRSAITPDSIKDFPRNTEVEALLTFANDAPSQDGYVASVTPDAHAVTVHEHTSMIALPEPGYKPRAFDPRAGFFPEGFRDYSAPLGEPMDKNYIIRHRLAKKDPNAAISEPVQPIIYYVDRGTPEPLRSALIEGASWWNQAFEAAGYKNAFRVEVLPEGADPMDIRYNMIQWVHRATRGWSYGAAVTDPRTGEIIKGQVTLGSLRSRQDYMIAEALLSPYVDGKPITEDMREMVLARTRQLACHEVGHTLGLEHNFAASNNGLGTSVMDYPHPWITLGADGKPDLSHAYATGIGAWDKAAITYGYSNFPPGTDEHAALQAILKRTQQSGLLFLSDDDSRPLGSANPHAHLWDNGTDAADELERILTVRKAALEHFGEAAIQPGEPMAELEDTLVPLYLLHRYQTEAAAKILGGEDYAYSVRGDGQIVTALIPAAEQQKALKELLKTLDPEILTLPESLLKILPPRPTAYPRTRESFAAHTGLTFDPLGAVEASASLTSSLLFEPSRASRLVEYHARDNSLPSLEDVLGQILTATWYAPRCSGLKAETQFTVESIVLNRLLGLAASSEASRQAKAIALVQVNNLQHRLEANLKETQGSAEQVAHWTASLDGIERFRRAPDKFQPQAPLETPPGQPIGDDEKID
jgi:Met-zincin/Domain of unknown function (DUF5117)